MNDWDQDLKLAKVPPGMPTAPAPAAELLAFDDWVWKRDGEPLGHQNGPDAARLAWRAAIEWERARQSASVERAKVAGEAVKQALADLCDLGNNTKTQHYKIISQKIHNAVHAIRTALASPPRSEGVRASEVRSDEPEFAKDCELQTYLNGKAISKDGRVKLDISFEELKQLRAALGAAQASTKPFADALSKDCGATNGCSCAELNYQWYGPHCEATMTSVFRAMLKQEASSVPSAQSANAAEQNAK